MSRNYCKIGYLGKHIVFLIFGHIWGNIIDYIDQKGYLWGITYVKSFAPILGFDYVSLPLISANMIGADYAQPGLVAEGYANWGIYGAIINMIFVFRCRVIV